MPADNSTAALISFIHLLAQVESMDNEELETFQNLLLAEGLTMSTNRCKDFTAAVHDATIHFLDHNRS